MRAAILVGLSVAISCGPTGAPVDPTDSPAPDTASSAPDTAWPDTGAGEAPQFVAELHGAAIAVRSNVPAEVAACVPAAWSCDDVDADGLTDAWEDGVLDRLRPELRFDEAEPLVDDASAVLAVVARVAPAADGNLRLYAMIGYSEDYGRCGLSTHHGDSERVVLDLARLPEGPGDVAVVGAYTAAHEGTITDGGRVFVGTELSALSFPLDPVDGQPRWRVFASDGKHASYGAVEDCESGWVPCVEEDCEADGADPALYTRVPPAFNAGEPDAPRLTELSAAGFPGEQAWTVQDFCGGLGGVICSAPVVDKLTVDPFAAP